MRVISVPVALLFVFAGCSGTAKQVAEVRHDSEQARVVLVAALDTWKRGEARALARRKPPIRFVDEDFMAGLRLTDFELDEPDTPILPYKDVPVILSMRDKRGRVIRREAHYQVTTDPALAVLRSDP
jgi:hypothetical protein